MARKIITKQAKDLHSALVSEGVEAELECWDGHKHVDICIPSSKMYIEVDGMHHFTNPDQVARDFIRDHYSDADGFNTLHIPNSVVETELHKVVSAIKKVVAKMSDLRSKSLKFTPQLCEQILQGSKTSTWRLFDDKDLQKGDVLEFLNKETLKKFGTATIITLYTKTLGTLEDSDWEGHERFASDEEMYATYRQYYGDSVNPDTEVKIISFDFKPL
jgi:uncharacterized protein YqfB (UPF0267 family)